MTLRPALRKAALTAHIAASVGWFGGVAASLALAVAALVSDDGERVRGVYLTLELIGWAVLVPLGIASLLTGVIQGLATVWGVFRHYWVVFKLLINVFATAILLLYMETLASLAERARATPPALASDELRDPSAALHAGAALVLLVAATTLSVYKPRGLTPLGRRAREQ